MKKFLGVLFFLINISTIHGDNHPTNQELFENKNIIILGGTGFLGRGIATEVLKYNPRQITIVSRDEVKHFNLIKIFGNNPKIQSIIGDVRDYSSILHATRGADVVFDAAALKRIDILESNAEECIKTNILGSMNVFNACVANNVPSVVFISTDKACSPVNVYGACKFASEKIFNNYDPSRISTKFVVARYGNVLESTGSVIPIFTDKILSGQEIPLTDERMTRYIITKEQAIALIFDALRYGIGGEIFVNRMPALKVVDLIQVIKDHYNADNKVVTIGLRPGEKLHEALVNFAELSRTFEFKNCLIIRPTVASLYSTQTPEYVTQGTPATKLFVNEYSSDQEVISKDQLAELFDRLGVYGLRKGVCDEKADNLYLPMF